MDWDAVLLGFAGGLIGAGIATAMGVIRNKRKGLESMAFGYWVALRGPQKWRQAVEEWRNPKLAPMRANVTQRCEKAYREANRDV